MSRDPKSCQSNPASLRFRKKRSRVTKAKFNSAAQSEDRRDIYERVTARIIADLEKGVRFKDRCTQSLTTT